MPDWEMFRGADGSSLDLIPYKETDGYIEKTMKYIDDYNRYYEEL